MTLEQLPSEKFLNLVSSVLNCLRNLLCPATITSSCSLTEEALSYLRVTFVLDSTHTVQVVNQVKRNNNCLCYWLKHCTNGWCVFSYLDILLPNDYKFPTQITHIYPFLTLPLKAQYVRLNYLFYRIILGLVGIKV